MAIAKKKCGAKKGCRARASKKKTSKKKAASWKPAPRPSKRAKPVVKDLPPLTDVRAMAAAITAHLKARGYEPVLVGESCAALYTGSSIKPRMMEFVVPGYEVRDMGEAMAEIGFESREMRTFSREGCPFEVMFNAPPILIGDEVADRLRTVAAAQGEIKMLTPTDCVKSRLSAFYRWRDTEALSEAVKVARRQKIDMDDIRRWSDREWCADRFEDFLNAIEGRR